MELAGILASHQTSLPYLHRRSIVLIASILYGHHLSFLLPLSLNGFLFLVVDVLVLSVLQLHFLYLIGILRNAVDLGSVHEDALLLDALAIHDMV